MTTFRVGEKDRDGRQKRIDYSGRYLRASRTGGVALRAHVKAAGINLTGNTSHGFRLSTRLAKNTQVAMQNGRFVLRGRYGPDIAKVNLSKSGVSVSSKVGLGTINWMRPGASPKASRQSARRSRRCTTQRPARSSPLATAIMRARSVNAFGHSVPAGSARAQT